MKNKKWILFLIILFPSLFWIILESGTINSKKLNFFGPKEFNGKDTIYYSLPNITFYKARDDNKLVPKLFDSINYPILVLTFIKPSYQKDGFRIGGLSDYTQYKKEDIEKLPILLVYPKVDSLFMVENNLKDSLNYGLANIEQCYWKASSFDSLNVRYFLKKPYYIDYSFFVMLDKQRRIRGFYDGRYVAEIKRMLGEYRHLRIKEEKQNLIKNNEIKNKSNE
jgi:hypothetical protein